MSVPRPVESNKEAARLHQRVPCLSLGSTACKAMSIPFSAVCTLLTDLEATEHPQWGGTRPRAPHPPRARKKPESRAEKQKRWNGKLAILDRWFDGQREAIGNDPRVLTAVYSLLLPHRRPDRVYGLKEPSLVQSVLPDCIGVGKTGRGRNLKNWRCYGPDGDLGSAVERLMAESPFAVVTTVTIDEVYTVLGRLASRSGFSSETNRRYKTGELTPRELLKPLWMRLTPWEAKWLTRIILMGLITFEMPGMCSDSVYQPILAAVVALKTTPNLQMNVSNVPTEGAALYAFHFLLPNILQVRNSIPDACAAICKVVTSPELAGVSVRPLYEEKGQIIKYANDVVAPLLGDLLKPELFRKIGRAEFIKATSVTHAHKTLKDRNVLVERKYDGEYCEIHIDLSRPPHNQFRIFSKNGKDATDDRHVVIPCVLSSAWWVHG